MEESYRDSELFAEKSRYLHMFSEQINLRRRVKYLLKLPIRSKQNHKINANALLQHEENMCGIKFMRFICYYSM